MTSQTERFMDRVMPVTESGCWLWMGRLDRYGHAFTDANTHTDSRGRRNCRKCYCVRTAACKARRVQP